MEFRISNRMVLDDNVLSMSFTDLEVTFDCLKEAIEKTFDRYNSGSIHIPNIYEPKNYFTEVDNIQALVDGAIYGVIKDIPIVISHSSDTMKALEGTFKEFPVEFVLFVGNFIDNMQFDKTIRSGLTAYYSKYREVFITGEALSDVLNIINIPLLDSDNNPIDDSDLAGYTVIKTIIVAIAKIALE